MHPPVDTVDEVEGQSVRPWYREPWPWVLIAIPVLTVIASGVTFWLAVSHPDYVVVEPQELQEIKTGLNAQPSASAGAAARAPDDHDGDR